MSKAKERVRPFPNGTAYDEWSSRNCGKCWRSYVEGERKSACKSEQALAFAYLDDGTISARHAKYAGLPDGDCPNRQEKRPPRPYKRRPRKEAPGQWTLAFDGVISCTTKP